MRVMPMDTGFPDADARDDFTRARCRQVLARLAARLRGQPGNVDVILPFDEVLAALGRVGERPLGLQMIDLDAIVGSVDRGQEFDRRFRPTSAVSRARGRRTIDAYVTEVLTQSGGSVQYHSSWVLVV
ncbi:hypothetical protein BH24ACT1_BH24ACT1_11930 [soil metagenome]